MTLDALDQFYLQKKDPTKPGSKLYTKHRVSVQELETYILGGYQDGVKDINDRLDQEIQDRKDGDSEIYAQIDGLTDRISTLGDQLYDTLVSAEYQYAIDNDSKENYDVLLVNNCPGLVGEDYINCNREQLDGYHSSVASSQTMDSRGKVFLVTNNYTYADVISIFLSDTIVQSGTKTQVDLSQTTKGSLIEVIKIKQDANGNDIVDNFDYGFYEVIDVFDPYPELSGSGGDNAQLFRFDVKEVGHAPAGGKPSVQPGENRYMVKLVVDLESTLGKVYVNKEGDSMSGPLFVSITSQNDPYGAALTTGIQTTNKVVAPELQLSGYSQLPNFNPPSVEITNPQETTIKINTPEKTILDIGGGFELRDPGGIRFSYTQEVVDEVSGEITTPALTKIRDYLVLENIAEYSALPNLLDPLLSGNAAIIPPRHYVDLQDNVLDNKITDVSQRIDTLANASDVFNYRMMLESETEDCDNDLENGAPGYPGYDADPSTYDPTDYQNGLVWAECIANYMKDNLATEPKLFDYRTFNKYEIQNDGTTTTEELDIFVLHHRTSLYIDPTDTPIDIDLATLGEVGNYFEISESQGRSTTYAVYIITSVTTINPGFGILTCKLLHKTDDSVITGFNYKIKFYDKNSGLNINDTDALYVRKTGDEMSGHLYHVIDETISDDIVKVQNLQGTILSAITNKGNIEGRELYLRERRGGDAYQLLNKEGIQFHPGLNTAVRFVNVDDKKFHFSFNNTMQFEINDGYLVCHNKRIGGVDLPVAGDEVPNLDWLSGKGSASAMNAFVFSPKGTLKFTANSNFRLEAEIGTIYLNDLANVDAITNLGNKHALLYNMEANSGRGEWQVSTDPIRAFIPGQKVAYTGPDPDNDVEVGGLYLSPSNFLFIKMS